MIRGRKDKKDISYRTRLITFFILAMLIAILVGLYSYMSSRVLMNDMTRLIERTQDLTELYNELDNIQMHTEDYLTSRSSESLQYFYDSSNQISDLMHKLEEDADYSKRGIKIKNLNGMLGNYLDILDKTIIHKRNKQIDDYVMGYQDALREYEDICGYIETIYSSDLTESAMQYTEIEGKIAKSTNIIYVLFIISILLIVVVIILFSNEMTKPLRKLVSYAQEVTKGNFDVEIKDDNTSSEIRILFQAFRMMTDSIKEYITQLEEKQKLERSLNEEKVNNLKMKSELHETELLALQSQVNPHFIFNSINIGSKIAMLQGDNVTCEYLENFAELFRYNLKGLGYNATLKEEIDNVQAYMNLLLVRFGDTFEFRLDIADDDEILQISLPRMTLQPLVENAFIHGASQREEGGIIELKAIKSNGHIVITISNTGSEMSSEMISQILSQKYIKPTEKNVQGHTTGIGIVNVLSRLRLFYKEEDVMSIQCNDGWTRFILTLPIKDGEEG